MKLSKQKALQGAGVVKDPRFARLHSDPRFQRAFKRKLKIPIDSRFRHIFSDKRFSEPLSLDKRGRKQVTGSLKKRHALREYYDLREDEELSHEEQEAERQGLTPPSKKESKEVSFSPNRDSSRDRKKKSLRDEKSDAESDEDDSEDSAESSESSTTSSPSDDYESAEDNTLNGDELENEKVPTTDTETRRLALVNMDWDHIKAVDILAVMNSFLPKGGQILSVTVYPSDFGLQQMKEEEKRGPQIFSEENDEEDEEKINEKLRKYEKAKLRYYYAIVECDSTVTADFLYKSCDGMEFERTSNTLDLRFVADDMNFTNEPRDVAKEVPSDYQAPTFETRALQHSKVKLTWDDDEPERIKVLHQKFSADQLNEMDFNAYLASDASSEEIDDNKCEQEHPLEDGELDMNVVKVHGSGKKSLRDKYRALLRESGDESASDSADDKDMEITFNSGLEELSKRLMEKNKRKDVKETVWETYLRKRKEKRKAQKQDKHDEDEENSYSDEDPYRDSDDPFFRSEKFGGEVASDSERELYALSAAKEKRSGGVGRKSKDDEKLEEKRSRAELELLLADEYGSHTVVKGYNLKKKLKGIRKEKESITEKIPNVNYDDPRFSALFTSHMFAIDPTEPEYKRSAANLKSLLEKQQKRLSQVNETRNVISGISEDVNNTKNKARQDLTLMVKSLKRKVATAAE